MILYISVAEKVKKKLLNIDFVQKSIRQGLLHVIHQSIIIKLNNDE